MGRHLLQGLAVQRSRALIIRRCQFRNPVNSTADSSVRADEISDAMIEAGFASVKTVHHESKPWITVIATKL